MNTTPMCGVVVIGRNEGDRLSRCLASLPSDLLQRTVYVDSGSSDDSVARARCAGAKVVELDPTSPFTAARARNKGFAVLQSGTPTDFVQFLDGDCQMFSRWIETALEFLIAHPDHVVVSGRRRERFPQASVYNRLCDWEWDTPIGPTQACGGDAMMRASAFAAVGGFNPTLIAGEEPELCVRLRARGGQIWRLDADMALHDAAITRFAQWWRRTLRGGYAFAAGAALHGAPPERHNVAQLRRALFWGAGAPLCAALATIFIGPWGFAVLAIYPLQVVRIALLEGATRRIAWERGFFLTLGKIPEALGVAKFHLQRVFNRRARIIEYK